MAQNYTRQSSFADGDTITAALFNNEFNQVVNAFAYSASSDSSTGHKHDGTSGQGGNIPQIGDIDFLNKIVVDSTNNRWGFYVQVSSGTVEQIRIQDGAIVPVTNNDIDLGTSSLEFKDLFLDGTAHIDTLDVDVNATVAGTLGVTGASTLTGNVTATNDLSVGGNLTVTGNATISGNLTFGDAATDTVAFSADVASNLLPSADNTYDLGASGSEWKDLYIDGTANIDSLVADTADINGGTIDSAVIGGTTPAAITGTAITATGIMTATGTSVFASLDISGDIDVDGTANLDVVDIDGAVDMATTLTVAGNVDFNGDLDVDGTTNLDVVDIDGAVDMASTLNVAGAITGTLGTAAQPNITSLGTLTTLTVDDITINGSTISDGAALTLDAATEICLDSDSGYIYLKDDGTSIGLFKLTSSDFYIKSVVSDKDIIFQGNDGGSAITALTLDMSEAGAATFNSSVTATSLDISGDIDVDGTTNLDVVDIDGAVDFGSTTAHAGNATFADNAKAIFGADSDLQIYSDGTTGQVTGNVNVTGTVTATSLEVGSATFEAAAVNINILETNTTDVNTRFRLNGGEFIVQTLNDAQDTVKSRLAIDNATGDINLGYEDTGTTPKLVWSSSDESLSLSSNSAYVVTNSGQAVNGLDIAGAEGSLGSYGGAISFGTGRTGRSAIAAVQGHATDGDANGLAFFTHASSGSTADSIKRMEIDANGDISFYDNSGVAKFFWDASLETLTLGGTEWPTTNIGEAAGRHMINYDGEPRLFLWDTSTGAAGNESYLMLGGKPTSSATTISGGSINGGVENASDAAGYLAFNTTNSAGTFAEAMRIDASGNVGINVSPSSWQTTSNRRALELGFLGNGLYSYASGNINMSGAAYFDGAWKYASTGVLPAYYNQSSGNHSWFTASSGTAGGAISWSESMRIDASGNVLVGKAIADNTTQGIRMLGSAGFASFVRDSAEPIVVNRLTDDGELIEFRKDGEPVGSWQSRAGAVSTIILDPRAGGRGLSAGTDSIVPTDKDGALSNGATDIGEQNFKFRNAYLSGGVYLGGTGAANKLDSYEEGTWTPTLVGSTTGGSHTYGYQNGKYTKIGNTVTASFGMYVSTKDGSMAGNVNVSGLPVSASMGTNVFANLAIGWAANITYGDMLGGYINSGTSIGLRLNNSAAAAGFLNSSAIGSGSVYLFGTITYQTA